MNGRNQNLILFIRGNAISEEPKNIKGINQFLNPLIRNGVIMEKLSRMHV